MGLILAPVHRVVLNVGEPQDIRVAGLDPGIDAANDRGGIRRLGPNQRCAGTPAN